MWLVLRIAIVACCLATIALPGRALGQPSTYLLTVDTSTAKGQQGYLDLQFNAGPLLSQAAYVNVSLLYTDGTLISGASAIQGNVTGTLAAGLTIANGPGLISFFTPTSTFTSATINEFNQPIIFGNHLQLSVTIDGPAIENPGAATATSQSNFGIAFQNSNKTGFLFTGGGATPPGFAGTITVNLNGSTTASSYSSAAFSPLYPALSTASMSVPYNAANQTLSVSTSVTDPLVGTPNGGTVSLTVYDGNNNVVGVAASATVANGAANTTYSLPASTSVGTYTVAATYSGFSSGSGSSFPATVEPFFSTLTVVPSTSVTVGASVSGPSFAVDGTSYSTPQTFVWAIGGQHNLSTATQQNVGGATYSFAGWSDNLPASHTVTASSTTSAYTAYFATSAYQLTTSASPSNGGSITVNGGLNNGYYTVGSTLNVAASPASGWVFTGWTGTVTGRTNPFSVVMNQPVSLTANFVQSVPVTVDAIAGTTHLPVSIDSAPAQIGPISQTWLAGSQHTITVVASQTTSGTQYTFANWSDKGAASHTVTANPATNLYAATFNTAYLLTANASPASFGVVQMNPSGTNGWYPAGTVVNVTAVAGPNYYFATWSGPVAQANGTAATVTMNAPMTVSAIFSTYMNSTMMDAFQVAYISQLNNADTVINVTNAGTVAGTSTIQGSGANGKVCLNIYVFDPMEEEVACCSCTVTPNELIYFNAGGPTEPTAARWGIPVSVGGSGTPGLLWNTVVGSGTYPYSSAVVKMVGTNPNRAGGAGCSNTFGNGAPGNVTAAQITSADLAPGLSAWATHPHATNGQSIVGPTGSSLLPVNIVETAFSQRGLSVGELNFLTAGCAYLQDGASGRGICSCPTSAAGF